MRPTALPIPNSVEMIAEIERAVRTHSAESGPADVLFDITPGRVLMTAALLIAARPGNRVLNIGSRSDSGSVLPVPRTETPHLWEVTAEGRLALRHD